MNRSQISNDFNFQNELDISNTRKDKTEHFFSKEGFQFEDFMNVGDRTFKSDKFESKLIQNTSKISRDNSKLEKEDQDDPPSKLLEDFSSTHLRPNRLPQECSKDELTVSNHSQPPTASPKFVQTTKSIPLSPRKQEFTLRRPSPKKEQPFLKREEVKRSLEEEWLSLEGQLRYYMGEGERLDYEGNRLEAEGEQLMASFNAVAHEAELEEQGREIKMINREIEAQRQLEGQLSRMVLQLEQQYEGLINSIKSSCFPRPTKVEDQSKTLINDINALKAELEAIDRDDGSLNLSSTLMAVPSSSLLKAPSAAPSPRRQQEDIVKTRIKEVIEAHRESGDPRFLQNVKMACLKNEWVLFCNSELQVSVSYREPPRVQLRIGNKLGSDLSRFTLRQEGVLKLQGEVIAGKSYYSHSIEVTPVSICQLFTKVELAYKESLQEHKITLFVPLGMTTFGEFSPITQKEFDRDAGDAPFMRVGGFRPIDRRLLGSVGELTVYMPNLLVGEDSACGLFLLPFEDCELVFFKQRGELLSVATRGDSWPLLRLLEFIFTL